MTREELMTLRNVLKVSVQVSQEAIMEINKELIHMDAEEKRCEKSYTPNEQTLESMERTARGEGLTEYNSVDEMIEKNRIKFAKEDE